MEKRRLTRFLAAFVLVAMAFSAVAQQQVPSTFNYQAIVRDVSGNVVADQSVTVKMTFLDNETVVSSQEYTVITNDFGLINIAADLLPAEFIGFSYADPKIKIEIDFGSGYVELGTNNLTSVPYAMNAGNVATLSEGLLTVGSGSSVVLADAAQVDENTAYIDALLLEMVSIQSTITVFGTTITDHSTRIEALEDAGFLTDETDPVFSSHPAQGINNVLINSWNAAYSWGNHASVGYLTLEADPYFTGSPAAGITSSEVTNWNIAYSWGDHHDAGYLTSFIESDPIFGASIASTISASDVSEWNTAYLWGDHHDEGYLTTYSETDPYFMGSPAAGITSSEVTHWNTAYSWGDHHDAGYLTSFIESDPIFGASIASTISASDVGDWNTAYLWGDHATQGYLTTFSETDPYFMGSPAAGITSSEVTHWNTAYLWGDHSTQGYLTTYSETDPFFIQSAAAGITTFNISDWNTAFGWGDHTPAINALQGELDDTQVGAGLEDDGSYPSTARDIQNHVYITGASSLYHADELLDAALYVNALNIATNSAAILQNTDDILANFYLIQENASDIQDVQSELDETQEGAGLNSDGSYPLNATKYAYHYMQDAGSLFNADELFDQAIYLNETAIGINANNIAINSDAIIDVRVELDNTQAGAGLTDDGSYPGLLVKSGSHYLNTASSLYGADLLLDEAIYTNEMAIDLNALNIATNSAAIAVNAGLIADNASSIAVNVVAIAQNASDIQNVQDELDVTQQGAGLNPDGTYPGGITKSLNYISTATSLYNADELLDAQIKTNADNITANLGLIQTNTVLIASNASDIESNFNLIDQNSHWIFDDDQDTYVTVEATADEDKIHIFQSGIEVLRIPQKGVLEVMGKSLAIGEGSGINQLNSDGKNTFVGSFAGHNTTSGINNLFIGNSAGKANISGSNNLYIGNEAGLLNAHGSENTFIGAASGRASQLNSGNTFIGARSGFSSSDGSNNTYIGINAGYNSASGSSNVLIGANVGYQMSTGEANTYIGNLAGYNTTSGYRNAFIGFQAGYTNTDGIQNTFIGNEAGYWETGSNKLYIANDRGANLTNGRDVALIYGEFDTDILNLNAITTVTKTMNAGESPNHLIGDGAFKVNGGGYIYKDFYVNGHSFLDQTTIDVNDGEFLIHDGEGYSSASNNGIMADVNGYIGLVSSVNSGNAQLGVQTIDENTRPTAAISVNAVVGGIDIQAAKDIYVDANTVYINGVDAAKGTNMAVGIGTDNTNGNIHVGYDEGQRIINIGQYESNAGFTQEINLGSNTINTHSYGNTTLLADADIDMDATNITGDATAAISFGAVTTSNFTVSTGNLELTSTAAIVAINAGTDVDIDGGQDVLITAGDQILLNASGIQDAASGTGTAAAIQLTSNGGIDLEAASDVAIDAANIYATAADGIRLESTNSDVTIVSGQHMVITTTSDVTIESGRNLNLTAAEWISNNAKVIESFGSEGVYIDAGTGYSVDINTWLDALTNIGGDLDIGGNTYNHGTLTVSEAAWFKSTVDVDGQTTLDATQIDLAENEQFDVNGTSGDSGVDFDVYGAISFDADAASNFNTSSGDLSFNAATGNVTIDGISVYINGTAAKGSTTAIGIGTNNAAGNIQIGYDDGAREIKLGKENATSEVDLAANMISVVSGSETVLIGGAKLFGTASDIEFKAKNDFWMDAGEYLYLGTSTASAVYIAQEGVPTYIQGAMNVSGAAEFNNDILLTGGDFQFTIANENGNRIVELGDGGSHEGFVQTWDNAGNELVTIGMYNDLGAVSAFDATGLGAWMANDGNQWTVGAGNTTSHGVMMSFANVSANNEARLSVITDNTTVFGVDSEGDVFGNGVAVNAALTVSGTSTFADEMVLEGDHSFRVKNPSGGIILEFGHGGSHEGFLETFDASNNNLVLMGMASTGKGSLIVRDAGANRVLMTHDGTRWLSGVSNDATSFAGATSSDVSDAHLRIIEDGVLKFEANQDGNVYAASDVYVAGTITSGNSITIDGTTAGYGVISESNNDLRFGTAALSGISTLTTTGNIETGGYFDGVVGAVGDLSNIYGDAITGTTFTDGTATLTGGNLTGVAGITATTVSSTHMIAGDMVANELTTASATVNGDLRVNATATFSGAIILSNGTHYWRFVINSIGDLEFQYSNDGISWGTGTSSSVAVFLKP
ncbi:MAG: hypothetical protein RBR21_07565 [Bacteroidales bacterium]|nr:hypothetical protein [Bacteroidales bacterium]